MAKKAAAAAVVEDAQTFRLRYADGTVEEVSAASVDDARNRARRDCGKLRAVEEVGE